MSIQQQVTINAHYTRSINLERDSSSMAVLKAYVPTSRALRTLGRVADTLHDGVAPRAWTLVGPYGSGKSSFSLFASELLSYEFGDMQATAMQKLRSVDEGLASRIDEGLGDSEGFLRVLVTGSPAPMSRALLAAIHERADELFSARRGRKPSVLGDIVKLLGGSEILVADFINCVKQLQSALTKAGYSGIVVVIDELGKFLEYEARHYGANDIFLLQALAEHACAGCDCNLLLFVTLHQSFEQYARGLGEHLRAEWAKVHGRFEEIPFLESQEQVLRVVASAIAHDFSKAQQKSIAASAQSAATALAGAGALPSGLGAKDAAALFASCYPLSPVAALVLPLLCQKVAQNERTLFSYLGSHEEHGLQDVLSRFESEADWVQLHHVFDYFVANQTASFGDQGLHRRWAEVATALDRVGDVPDATLELLKAIGLLNIVGARDGLKASEDVLQLAASEPKVLRRAISALKKKSVVTFRKFGGEYRVWQGSDFDLEEAFVEAKEQLGEFDLAETLNKGEFLPPVVARRYTIRNGALRFFTPQFVDARTLSKGIDSLGQPRIVLFLAASKDDESVFLSEHVKSFDALDVVAVCNNGAELRETTREVLALERIGHSSQELANDPVAKREFSDRLGAARVAQKMALNGLFESPGLSAWHHNGKQLDVSNKRTFQEALSAVLESVYRKCPTVHNELVNRDKPSSNANAARIKLLHAMMHHADKPDLGMDKFPPEKGIYRSVLFQTGLHREVELNQWQLCEPEKGTPFYDVWQRIESFLESTEGEPRAFIELNKELMAPPYGVKAGLLPILYFAVYCTQRSSLAVYEQRKFMPSFTPDMLDRFVKRPDEFKFQRFRVDGLRQSIYDEYLSLFEDNNDKTVLQLVRPLADLISGLDEFTMQTRSHLISEPAKKLREAFKLAKSPHALLFEDLPKALGFGDQIASTDKALTGYAEALTNGLRELKYAQAKLRTGFKELIAQSFHVASDISLSELRKEAATRYRGLDAHTVDVDGVKAFITRVTNTKVDDDEWLDNVLMFLGRKPSGKWTDADMAEAEARLADFSKRLLDLRSLRLHYDKTLADGQSDIEVILLKSMRAGGSSEEQVVDIDAATHQAIAGLKKEMNERMAGLTTRKLRLALLAELVDEFLNDQEQSKKAPAAEKRNKGKMKRVQ